MLQYEIVSPGKRLASKGRMRNSDKLLLRTCQFLRPVFDSLKAAQNGEGLYSLQQKGSFKVSHCLFNNSIICTYV